MKNCLQKGGFYSKLHEMQFVKRDSFGEKTGAILS